MRYSILEKLHHALKHPFLAAKFICGKDPSVIGLGYLSKLIHTKTPTILEAGAFNGDDTFRFIEKWPLARVYAFEAVPELFVALVNRFTSFEQIKIENYALVGKPSREVSFHTFSSANSTHGSSSILTPTEHISRAPEVSFSRQLTVQGITLDDWLIDNEIRRLDLLWLDLQGAELIVLRSATNLLKLTSVCHLEVSKERLYEGSALFEEINEFMESHDFRLVRSRLLGISGNAVFTKI